MSLKSHIVSGLKWTAGARVGGLLVTWAITIFVMRLLSPADYGLQAIASVFVAFLLLMAEAGLGPALVQKDELTDDKLRQAFGIALTVNLCLLLLLNALAPAIAAFFGNPRLEPILRVLSLQFPIIALATIPEVLMERRLNFKMRSLIDLTAAIAGSLLTLALALSGHGVWSLVFGNLGFALWKAVAANLVSPFRHWPRFGWRGTRSLLSFGGNVTAARLLWFLYTQLDVLIIGKLLGKEALGFYSIAMHIASLPTQRVSSILNQVVFPTFSRYQHDKDLLREHLLKGIGLLSFFAFPVLWGIASVADGIVLALLGARWDNAILPLQLLALIMPFRMIANFLPTVTDALGRPELALQNVALGCVVMPAAFCLGAPWGIAGVALAWVTAYPVVWLINVRRMAAAIGLRLTDVAQAMLPSGLAAAGMFGIVHAARVLLPLDQGHGSALAFMIVSGAAVYTVLTLLLNRRTVDGLMTAMVAK